MIVRICEYCEVAVSSPRCHLCDAEVESVEVKVESREVKSPPKQKIQIDWQQELTIWGAALLTAFIVCLIGFPPEVWVMIFG